MKKILSSSILAIALGFGVATIATSSNQIESAQVIEKQSAKPSFTKDGVNYKIKKVESTSVGVQSEIGVLVEEDGVDHLYIWGRVNTITWATNSSGINTSEFKSTPYDQTENIINYENGSGEVIGGEDGYQILDFKMTESSNTVVVNDKADGTGETSILAWGDGYHGIGVHYQDDFSYDAPGLVNESGIKNSFDNIEFRDLQTSTRSTQLLISGDEVSEDVDGNEVITRYDSIWTWGDGSRGEWGNGGTGSIGGVPVLGNKVEHVEDEEGNLVSGIKSISGNNLSHQLAAVVTQDYEDHIYVWGKTTDEINVATPVELDLSTLDLVNGSIEEVYTGDKGGSFVYLDETNTEHYYVFGDNTNNKLGLSSDITSTEYLTPVELEFQSNFEEYESVHISSIEHALDTSAAVLELTDSSGETHTELYFTGQQNYGTFGNGEEVSLNEGFVKYTSEETLDNIVIFESNGITSWAITKNDNKYEILVSGFNGGIYGNGSYLDSLVFISPLDDILGNNLTSPGITTTQIILLVIIIITILLIILLSGMLYYEHKHGVEIHIRMHHMEKDSLKGENNE